MLSPSGKIEWSCCFCNSLSIEKERYGPMGQQNVGYCSDCKGWWPWSMRLKLSFKGDQKRMDLEARDIAIHE